MQSSRELIYDSFYLPPSSPVPHLSPAESTMSSFADLWSLISDLCLTPSQSDSIYSKLPILIPNLHWACANHAATYWFRHSIPGPGRWFRLVPPPPPLIPPSNRVLLPPLTRVNLFNLSLDFIHYCCPSQGRALLIIHIYTWSTPPSILQCL